MNLNHYETIFIINPVLSDQQVKDTITGVKRTIESFDGQIYHEEEWGIRKLAYPIKHKTTGYYQLFEFRGPPTIVAKIEIAMKRDESILRFLTVSLEKHALEFNERRRKGEFNKTKEKEEAQS